MKIKEPAIENFVSPAIIGQILSKQRATFLLGIGLSLSDLTRYKP